MYSVVFNRKLKNNFKPFLLGDDDLYISLINSLSLIGITGLGKSEFYSSILAESHSVNSKLHTNFDLKKHRLYKLFDVNELFIFVYYMKDNIFITIDANKYNYHGISHFKKNELVYFKNSHDHSFQYFKENILSLALCEPSVDDFLEVFEQDILLSEKLTIYKMLEI